MKKILIFATYPIALPQHGGQKRVRALFDAYYSLNDVDVSFSAIYFPPHYKDYWKTDIEIPRQYSLMMMQNPLTGDVIAGRLVRDDKKLRNTVKNRILAFKPDIIEIEHPFLYIGLKSILLEIGFTGRIIYSSHNIEYSMKKEMLENENFDSELTEAIVKEIRDIELELANDADLIFAVSQEDIESLTEMVDKKNKIVLARNGIERSEVSKEDIEYWDKHFDEMGVNKIALFVGSAHPPNWTGFQKMVGPKIGFLQKNERIVLAGSIGEYFNTYYSNGGVEDTLFWKRVITTGRLSEERLSGLIARADCLILPIVEGGGSNLKTAEALLSGKPVIGTGHAFRAFESFLHYPTVKMADDPKEFRELIGETLRSEKPKLTKQQIQSLDEVTWDECLSQAVEGVKSL